MKTTVLIPTHNRLNWLKEAYASIDEPDVEIYILANGCTDGTNEWLNTLQDPRVVHSIVEAPMGVAAVVSLIGHMPIHLEGYATILCDDDRLRPGGLKLRRAFLDDHPELAMVFTRTHTIDAEGNDLGLHQMGGISEQNMDTGAMDFSRTLCGNYVPGVTAMWRTSAINKFFHWQNAENFAKYGACVDWMMWLKICEAGLDGGYLNTATTDIRMHSSALSATESQDKTTLDNHMSVWRYWIKAHNKKPTLVERVMIIRFIYMLAQICEKNPIEYVKDLFSEEELFEILGNV